MNIWDLKPQNRMERVQMGLKDSILGTLTLRLGLGKMSNNEITMLREVRKMEEASEGSISRRRELQ